jgi:hypothetical protein
MCKLNSIPKYFYHNHLINIIKSNIHYTYNALITKFLVNVFKKCDYRLIDDDIVCSFDAIELFSLREFILKYLEIIEHVDDLDVIVNNF